MGTWGVSRAAGAAVGGAHTPPEPPIPGGGVMRDERNLDDPVEAANLTISAHRVREPLHAGEVQARLRGLLVESRSRNGASGLGPDLVFFA